MEKERGQLTLFDCRKVVSGKSWNCFSDGDILAHKATLLCPQSSMHLLLNTLRKLDCYRLQLSDLTATEIGRAAATVAAHHPRMEVSRLAASLVEKWRTQWDNQLFCQIDGYDIAAAAEAPEGDPTEFQLQAPPPPPPPPPPEPTRVQPARKDRATRLKEEEQFLEGSDFEGISESESEEESDADDWQPGARRKTGASTGGDKRKSSGSVGGDRRKSGGSVGGGKQQRLKF